MCDCNVIHDEIVEAVKEGYLVDYRTREYKTKIMEEGIHYDQLSEEEKEAFDDEFDDDENVEKDIVCDVVWYCQSSNMKRKVLFLIESLGGGGAEKVLDTLVHHLDKDKFDVTVLSQRRHSLKKSGITP